MPLKLTEFLKKKTHFEACLEAKKSRSPKRSPLGKPASVGLEDDLVDLEEVKGWDAVLEEYSVGNEAVHDDDVALDASHTSSANEELSDSISDGFDTASEGEGESDASS